MNSAIYVGKVRHRRVKPIEHLLQYRIYEILIDIDELEEIASKTRGFGTRRRSFFGFNPRLHGPRDGSSLRLWAEGLCRQAGAEIDGGSIRVLCLPQILGYAFDPITEWYCYDREDRLAVVIHEVNNTFGLHHFYVVRIDPESPRHHEFSKQMHVSPFNKVEGSYRFSITEPGKTVSIAIEYVDDEGDTIMTASFSGVRHPLTTRSLWRHFFTRPLVTFKATAGIYFQALKIWRKGLRINRSPEPPNSQVTIVGVPSK